MARAWEQEPNSLHTITIPASELVQLRLAKIGLHPTACQCQSQTDPAPLRVLVGQHVFRLGGKGQASVAIAWSDREWRLSTPTAGNIEFGEGCGIMLDGDKLHQFSNRGVRKAKTASLVTEAARGRPSRLIFANDIKVEEAHCLAMSMQSQPPFTGTMTCVPTGVAAGTIRSQSW